MLGSPLHAGASGNAGLLAVDEAQGLAGRWAHTRVARDQAASSESFTLWCRCSQPPLSLRAASAVLHAHSLDGSRPSSTLSATPCIRVGRVANYLGVYPQSSSQQWKVTVEEHKAAVVNISHYIACFSCHCLWKQPVSFRASAGVSA